MSKLVEDVKSGLKGVRGAGDAIRGSVLEATDQAFEKNPHDPDSVAHQQQNHAITEKGKQDIRGADEMIARREWEREGVNPPGSIGTTENRHTEMKGAGPGRRGYGKRNEARENLGSENEHPLGAQARSGPVLGRETQPTSKIIE